MFSSKSFKHLSWKTGLVTLLSLVSLLGADSSTAAVLNGGFETVDPTTNWASGWEQLGRTSIKTAEYGSGSIEGTNQVLLDTFCPALTTDLMCDEFGNSEALAGFLGLPLDELYELGTAQVFEGSALKQTFNVQAGDVLSFYWNFLTDEDSGDTDYNDFAFVTLSEGVKSYLADTFSTPLNSSSTVFEYETGFQKYEYTFTTAGTYTLGLAVVDVSDGTVESGLLVDSVSLTSSSPSTSIPEPTFALSLLAFGAFGIGSQLVRRRQ